jgi:hypothetical protein
MTLTIHDTENTFDMIEILVQTRICLEYQS